MIQWETAVDVRTPLHPALLTTPTPIPQDTIPYAQLPALSQGITETAPIQERPCGWSNPPINMARIAPSKALSMVSHSTYAVLPSPSTSGGKRFNGWDQAIFQIWELDPSQLAASEVQMTRLISSLQTW